MTDSIGSQEPGRHTQERKGKYVPRARTYKIRLLAGNLGGEKSIIKITIVES